MSSRMSAKGWVVTFAGTGINLALGVLYTWSVVAKSLTDPASGWGLSAEAASIPYAVACGVLALMILGFGVLAGALFACRQASVVSSHR